MSILLNLALVAVAFALALCCRYLWRVRGMGGGNRPRWIPNKFVAILMVGALGGALSVTVACLIHGFSWWLFLLLPAEIVCIFILAKPSWGELFPDLRQSYDESFAKGVFSLTEYLAGYEYGPNTPAEKVLFWKATGWLPRFALYGMPLAILKAGVTYSLAPLIIWPLASLWVGWIYLRAYHNHGTVPDWNGVAEKDTGFLLGLLLNLMLAT